MASFYHGYRIDLEQREHSLNELMRTSQLLPHGWRDTAPAEIDPRDWHRIEDQGSMGSCQGHALSSVCEMAYRIATRGQVIQFSPLFAYLTSQKEDDILGSDSGSTINGGRKAAMEYGCCRLELCPYPRPVKYTTNISQAAIDAAKDFKIRSHTLCRNYDDVFAFLASGQGGVEIGIAWGDGMTPDRNGLLDRFSPGEGGHAVCFLGYTKDKDRDGRNYLWLANSWTEQWGDRGWAMVSPRAIDQMSRHQDTVMCGLSDLSAPEVREIDFAGAL